MTACTLSDVIRVADRILSSTELPLRRYPEVYAFEAAFRSWKSELLRSISELQYHEAIALHSLVADLRGYVVDWSIDALSAGAPSVGMRTPDGALLEVRVTLVRTGDDLARALEAVATTDTPALVFEISHGICSKAAQMTRQVHIQTQSEVAAAFGAEALWALQSSRAEAMLALPRLKAEYLAALQDAFNVSFSELSAMYRRWREIRTEASTAV